MNSSNPEIISGSIEDIVFRSDDTGFTVLEVACEDELMTVVGEFADVCVGEKIKATGRFTTHSTYGLQFKADFIERELPDNEEDIFKYLSSGVVKGIGPALAARIVDKFGSETIEIMENSPERLCEIKGITPQKCEKISDEFKRLFGIRNVMLHLSNYGITSGKAVLVWKKWGMTALNIINENPYLLCGDDIGMSFQEADSIADSLEMPEDSFYRIQGAILYVLRANVQNGHCCVPYKKLVDKAMKVLETDEETIENSVQNMVESRQLAVYRKEPSYVYLESIYEAESFISGRIKMMLLFSDNMDTDCEKSIDALEEKFGIKYAALQRKAITEAMSKGIFILTGGPGTGKTTTLNGIISLLEQSGRKVALAAPTGRAAKRMSEVTGREAKTIHRLLEVDFKDENGVNKFKRNAKNPLPFDAIIIDEMSMVDVLLFENLLLALRLGCKLIMVGDSDQLPPVGPGNILKDLWDSGLIAGVNLTEIFRQAAKSLIVTNAHKIIKGVHPVLDVKDNDFFFMRRNSMESASYLIGDLVCERLPKAYDFSPLWDIQVLCPSKIGVLGTNELNLMLQSRLNPPQDGKNEFKTPFTIFREGDKVMQVRNNYDIIWERNGEEGMGIFNGDIGIVEMIDKASKTISINFDERIAYYTFEMANELELAYAVTIHKSQGNEFDAVIIPLMGSKSKLHYRNLLYTGITRARKILILVGSSSTVYEMVDNDRKTLRYTNLTAMLRENDEENTELC